MQVKYTMPNRALFFGIFLALSLIGMSIVFVTYQNLAQQKHHIHRHILLAAKAVSRGIEATLQMGLVPRMHLIQPQTQEFLLELIKAGDIVFLNVYTSDGKLFLSTDKNIWQFSTHQWEKLKKKGEWEKLINRKGEDIFVFATQTRLSFAPPKRGRMRRPPSTSYFMVIGLNASDHFSLYNDYKRAAIWQVVYVFGVAILLFVLGTAYFKRKEQAGKVKDLEHFQSQLLDTMPEGLVMVDSEDVITAANPAMHTLLNAENSSLVGSTWSSHFPSRESSLPPHSRIAFSEKTHEWQQAHFQGRDLEILSVPLEYSQKHQNLILIRDRTVVKQMEQDLQEAKRLASIGHLAAGLAHEIRNPLSAIRGLSQFLAKKLKGKNPEETYASTMVTEADRLNKVIGDLLSLSSPPKIKPTQVSLPSLFKDLKQLLELDLDHKGISLTSSFEVEELYADYEAAKQILLNLILNALHVVPEKTGAICLSSSKAENGTMLFVQDNGPGIPPEARSKIFDPFYTTRPKGTGLGLAIVQKLVLEHQGRIQVTDQVSGQGAVFTLFFPQPKHSTDDQEQQS